MKRNVIYMVVLGCLWICPVSLSQNIYISGSIHYQKIMYNPILQANTIGEAKYFGHYIIKAKVVD